MTINSMFQLSIVCKHNFRNNIFWLSFMYIRYQITSGQNTQNKSHFIFSSFFSLAPLFGRRVFNNNNKEKIIENMKTTGDMIHFVHLYVIHTWEVLGQYFIWVMHCLLLLLRLWSILGLAQCTRWMICSKNSWTASK